MKYLIKDPCRTSSLFLILFASISLYANTGAPILGVPSIITLLVFPLIIGIEGYYYNRLGALSPFKRAAIMNIISSIAGGIILFIAGFLQPFNSLTYFDMLKPSLLPAVISLVLNYLTTVAVEFFVLRVILKRFMFKWESGLKLKHLFTANFFSYLLLAAVLIIDFLRRKLMS